MRTKPLEWLLESAQHSRQWSRMTLMAGSGLALALAGCEKFPTMELKELVDLNGDGHPEIILVDKGYLQNATHIHWSSIRNGKPTYEQFTDVETLGRVGTHYVNRNWDARLLQEGQQFILYRKDGVTLDGRDSFIGSNGKSRQFFDGVGVFDTGYSKYERMDKLTDEGSEIFARDDLGRAYLFESGKWVGYKMEQSKTGPASLVRDLGIEKIHYTFHDNVYQKEVIKIKQNKNQ